MKKLITFMVALTLVSVAFAGVRVVEKQPNSSDICAIGITDYSRLSSIICDVGATGETNSFTITVASVPVSGTTNTYTYATAIADDIAGAETVHMYNSDMDATTDHTMWLKPGDVLNLTGNDAAQTAYSNVYYYVVLEKVD